MATTTVQRVCRVIGPVGSNWIVELSETTENDATRETLTDVYRLSPIVACHVAVAERALSMWKVLTRRTRTCLAANGREYRRADKTAVRLEFGEVLREEVTPDAGDGHALRLARLFPGSPPVWVCDCRGHVAHNKCKHADAVPHLLQRIDQRKGTSGKGTQRKSG